MVANPRRPASSLPANSNHSPETPSSSNTDLIPTTPTTPTSAHSSLPPPEPLSTDHHPGSNTQITHSISRSSSTTSLATSPQSHEHRTPAATGATPSQKPSQLIMLHEHPPSPFILTSALAPPSLIPMTAAGISAKSSSAKKTSRKSPAASLKLSMLPSTMSPTIPTSNSGNAATPVFTFSTHHQAYAHSLLAQQQLQLQQKEIIHQATRSLPQHLLSTSPMSPRLIPLGSPGPVTPLTLEDSPDGFFASSHGFGHQQLNQQLSIVASGQRGGL